MRPPRKPRYVSKPTRPDHLIPPTAPTPEVVEDKPTTGDKRAVSWDRLSKLWTKRSEPVETSEPAPKRKVSSTPLSLTERRQQLAELKRSKLLKKISLGAVAMLVLGLLVWLFFFSTFFAVKADKLQVTINDDAGVVDPVAVQAIADSAIDTPILRINTQDLTNQLTERPDIASATVTTNFPQTMVVEVTGTQAVACIGSAESCIVVDREGETLERISPEAKAVLPVISMTLNEDTQHRVAGLLDALAVLPQQIRDSVQTATISDTGLIEFSTDTTTVKWGESTDNETKAQVVAALLQTGAGTIDVTVPTAPVTY